MAYRPKRPKSRTANPAGNPENTRGSGEVRVGEAQKAWSEGRFDDAIWLYERALARQPTNAVLLVDLARAYGLRFRHADAEVIVDRACRLHPKNANLQRMLGRSYVRLQQFDRAISCFCQALEISNDASERARDYYELAQMYERLHRLDDARSCVERSLELAPRQPALQYLLAVIERRSGDEAAAEARLKTLIEGRQAVPETIADASYQLASIFDRQGKFDEAMAAARQAKQTLSKFASRFKDDAADIANTSGKTHRLLTAAHFERWGQAAAGFGSSPGGGLALLTGHPRSGTTLLEQVLDSHPGLISADEVQAMADIVYLPLCRKWPTRTPLPEILDSATNEDLEKLRQAYRSGMEGSLRESIGERILLDKNPALAGLLPLVARVFPEMKIVFALRDPRDVVLSCYLQQLPLNPVSVQYHSLEDTATAYAATMRGWLKLRELTRNPWIEVRYEDTVADIAGQARRVLEFLNLAWDDSVLKYRDRAQQKHVHSPTYEAVAKPIYTSSIGRWKNYAKYLERSIVVLQPYLDAFGYGN